MDKVAKPIDMKFMRGIVAHSINPVSAGYKNPGPTDNLRGVEANTARSKGTKFEVGHVDSLEYATATDVPHSDPFKVHGEY